MYNEAEEARARAQAVRDKQESAKELARGAIRASVNAHWEKWHGQIMEAADQGKTGTILCIVEKKGAIESTKASCVELLRSKGFSVDIGGSAPSENPTEIDSEYYKIVVKW